MMHARQVIGLRLIGFRVSYLQDNASVRLYVLGVYGLPR
jgi:hypothetical protein